MDMRDRIQAIVDADFNGNTRKAATAINISASHLYKVLDTKREPGELLLMRLEQHGYNREWIESGLGEMKLLTHVQHSATPDFDEPELPNEQTLMFRKLLQLEHRISVLEEKSKQEEWKRQLQAEESAEAMAPEDSKRLVALAQAPKHYSAAATPLTEQQKGEYEQ